MKVDPLPPIPSPPAHLWRQFRVKVVPFGVFAVALTLTVWLWAANQTNPRVMGTAHGLEADVASPQAGKLVALQVTRYEEVVRGQVIGTVRSTNPQVASNTLAVVTAEMMLLRTEAGYDAGDRLRYGQLELNWMLERAELIALQQQAAYAEAEYRRVQELLEKKIVDESQYDIARRDLEQARESVAIRSAAVERIGQTLEDLDPQGLAADSPSVRASLDLLSARLRLAEAEFKPVLLKAPIDGRISKIYKLEGATVADGEPVVTVASPEVDYILGYIGQPIRVEPELGMDVEVRTRGLHSTVGTASITEVGPRVELFNAPLRVRGMGNAQQRGLPILVSLPPNMPLRPGELVDLRLDPLN